MTLVRDISNAITPETIDSLKAKINSHSGLARPNRFGVVITPPTDQILNFDSILNDVVRGQFSTSSIFQNSNDLSLFVQTCQFPGRNIDTLDAAVQRHAHKFPTGYTNEDVTFTFVLPNDYFIKEMFDAWQAMVIDPVRYRAGYKEDYTSDIIVQQLDAQDHPVYSIKLTDAYPVGVNSIELDNTSENPLSIVSVTFTYSDMQRDNALSGIIGKAKGFLSSIPKLPTFDF